MDECPNCGSKEVITDSEGGHDIRVCAECGFIVSEAQILTDAPSLEGTTITDGSAYAPQSAQRWMKGNRKTEAKGKTNGVKFIKSIAQALKYRDYMTDSATQLFEKAFDDVLKCRMDIKLALCACCIYVVGRQNDYAVTIEELLYFLQMESARKKFGTMMKLLKANHNIILEGVSRHTTAHLMLSKAGFPPELIKQTQQLLQLLDMTMLIEGRSDALTIVAASYLVWRASDNQHRRTSLPQYCRKNKFPHSKRLGSRKTKTEELLRKLVLKLPWICSETAGQVDLDGNLKDVIRFQRTLMQKTFASAREILLQSLCEDDAENSINGQDQGDEHGAAEKDGQSGPPSKRQRTYDWQADTDPEIDDSDLDQYIKSEAEVAEYSKLYDTAMSNTKMF